MNNNEESMMQFAEFIKMKKDEEELRPFDKKAVAALIEHAVRMTERKEKFRSGSQLLQTYSGKLTTGQARITKRLSKRNMLTGP